MALFKVKNIIDANTIEVTGWKWNDGEQEYAGKLVKIANFNVVKGYESIAESRLKTLIYDKTVELKGVQKVEKGSQEKNDIVYCSVYLNDIDIKQYFPEFV